MKRRFSVTCVAIGALGAFLSTTAQGYYHFVHFANRFGPFQEIPLKFDLNYLADKTVYYFISNQAPTIYNGNDNLNAVVSEIRAAADAWNSVATSNIRLAFGGFEASGTTATTPGIDVVFSSDIPPGLLELAGPTVPPINTSFGGASVATTANGGNFIPIVRSTLIMNQDLSQQPASFTEAFFTTLVHEFGHTLGLQHTLTSSAMSTAVTRSTTKASPLGPDDIAGISLLYPAANFGAATGSITGQVTLNGSGIGMASVVAISPSGNAVSNLTNPDGTYRIDGIPPGQYYVYVHPLPPAYSGQASPADIRLPVDANGNNIAAGPSFDTIFYPSTKDWSQAMPLLVSAGASTNNINFSVQPRSTINIYAVQTYGFFGQNPVKSPPLLVGSNLATIYASGFGLAQGSTVPAGLNVSTIGGAVPLVSGSLKMYSLATNPPYIQMSFAPSSGSGPRHLTFTLNNELYVLPWAFTLQQNLPPVINSISPAVDGQGNRAVLITGTNLFADTRILFEGASARVVQYNADGSLLVSPPPAPGGYTATVVALNSDGQSSLFVQGQQPPTYTYDSASQAIIVLTPNSLPAGSDAMVDVQGANTNFTDGVTVLGLGSSDIIVRRVWVLSPTHLIANVSVRSAAVAGWTNLTVATGLQSVSLSAGFRVMPANANAVTLVSPVLNSATGLNGTPAGGVATVNVTNLPTSALTLTVGGQPATISSIIDGQISFQVPAGTPAGPAILKLQDASGDSISPIVMQVSPPPPAITGAFIGGSTGIDATHPVLPGGMMTLAVTGVGDPTTLALSRLKVTVSGITARVIGLAAANSPGASALVQILLDPATPAGTAVPVVIALDSNPSAAFPVFVQAF